MQNTVEYQVPLTDQQHWHDRFDVVELSAGFLSFPSDDWLRLVDRVHSYGLKAKPELGIQFGAGGGIILPYH